MRRLVLLALPAAAALILPAFDAPEHRDPSQQEFSKLLDAADKAFARKDFITSAESLQQGILVATGMLRASLLSVMPIAPRGFTEVPMPAPQVQAGDPIAASVAMNPNRPVEQRYRRADGIGEIRVLVSPNSPAATAAGRALARVDSDPSSELVEVGTRVGVLTTRRADFSVRFVIGDSHLVEVRAHDVDPAVVLAMVDAAFLDRVAQNLGS